MWSRDSHSKVKRVHVTKHMEVSESYNSSLVESLYLCLPCFLNSRSLKDKLSYTLKLEYCGNYIREIWNKNYLKLGLDVV